MYIKYYYHSVYSSWRQREAKTLFPFHVLYWFNTHVAVLSFVLHLKKFLASCFASVARLFLCFILLDIWKVSMSLSGLFLSCPKFEGMVSWVTCWRRTRQSVLCPVPQTYLLFAVKRAVIIGTSCIWWLRKLSWTGASKYLAYKEKNMLSQNSDWQGTIPSLFFVLKNTLMKKVHFFLWLNLTEM